MKRKRIAINGFGRIGRTLLRILLDRDNTEVVAINDVYDIDTMAHLFKYDSVHGKFSGEVSVKGDQITVNGKSIRFFSQRDPAALPWRELQIDIVVESTGQLKTSADIEKHIAAGARHVLLSAPSDDRNIKTIVCGVNDHVFSGGESVISCASCTTNSAAPMIQLIEEMCGIESCYITTVHSYTGDQRLHDAPHKDWRRGRAAAESIVPTTTGAAKALTRIFPQLTDRMGGCGIRVPVPDGSLTDITCIVERPHTIEMINAVFKVASLDRYKGILEYTEDPVVSADVIGTTSSCLFDAKLTSVIGKMVKVVGWYDNEFGYSNRLADILDRWFIFINDETSVKN